MPSNLLTKIYSKYILNDILSFIDIKQKLKIIKHNKPLQKKLEITLEDFKNGSELYIKRLEEYDWIFTKGTNHAIFKGKIVNGLKEGQGKEFYTKFK